MGCKTCDERLENLMRLEADRNRYKDETNTLWTALQKERARLSVHDLMRIASTSVQLAKLSANGFPKGDSVADEASLVALGAFERVRERLEEGARDGDAGE